MNSRNKSKEWLRLKFKSVPTHCQVQDNYHTLQSFQQHQDATQPKVCILLVRNSNLMPEFRGNTVTHTNVQNIPKHHGIFGKSFYFTFDPRLLGRFTITSSLDFLNSSAWSEVSPLFAGSKSRTDLFPSTTFEYAIWGFFFPWIGAMNKTYMKSETIWWVHE